MRKLFMTGLLSILLLSSTPLFAVVRLVADCTTTDQNRYEFLIFDNQGIGMTRVSHFSATINDIAGSIVGSYDLKMAPPELDRDGYARPHLVDQETDGARFSFIYPSTRTSPEVTAVLIDGAHVGYGINNERNIVCTHFHP